MPKEKRTYHAEVIVSSSLNLQKAVPQDEKVPDPFVQGTEKRQIFSPELISRLAERIKKL